MLGKGKRGQNPKSCADQIAGHITDRFKRCVAVVLASARGRLRLQFLLSNARWSDSPHAAAEVADQGHLNVVGRLVGPLRACAKLSFRYFPPPRPFLSSPHWEQVRLGPSCLLCAAHARGIPSSRGDALRPLPWMLPPGSSCPSSLPVFPRLKVCPFRVRVTSSRAGLAPSWMTLGEGSLGLAKVKSCSVHFTSSDPTMTNARFLPAYPLRVFTSPRLSPSSFAFFSHPDSASSLS